MASFTRKAILTTFEDMLQKTKFDKITVSALIAKCGISPNTFYYHFRSIYDLLDAWLHERLNQYAYANGQKIRPGRMHAAHSCGISRPMPPSSTTSWTLSPASFSSAISMPPPMRPSINSSVSVPKEPTSLMNGSRRSPISVISPFLAIS